MKGKITQLIKDNILIQESLLNSQLDNISKVAEVIIGCYRKGGKVIFIGNGGSASQAEHLSAELMGRFMKDRRALPALSLTENHCLITSLANDFSFSEIFSKQLDVLLQPSDILIGISTSGNSLNIIKGVKVAKDKKIVTVGFCGRKSKLSRLVDIAILVNSDSTARIQEAHILIGHIICQLVEERLFS
jgi:D-sedoheptulose 7-phosphate isomerase